MTSKLPTTKYSHIQELKLPKDNQIELNQIQNKHKIHRAAFKLLPNDYLPWLPKSNIDFYEYEYTNDVMICCMKGHKDMQTLKVAELHKQK